MQRVKSTIVVNESQKGEMLHKKVQRIMETGEKIDDGIPEIFTDRNAGINPDHDIRTDKWDQALDMIEKYDAAEAAKGDGIPGPGPEDNEKDEEV